MVSEQQLDLFADFVSFSPNHAPPMQEEAAAPVSPAELSDDALLERIRRARIADCRALAVEAGRRSLAAAVPALEALCRRFTGFGVSVALPEQVAALGGFAGIGGVDAARVVARMIAQQVVQGPGLIVAAETAASLGSRLSAGCALALLRDPEPRVRAAACRCAPHGPEVVAVMVELLGDLHAPVSRAAACALGRMGRREARPLLVEMLCRDPSAEVIDAAASLGDEECLVLLGRIGRTRSELAEAVLMALEASEGPHAAAIARSVRGSLA